MPNWCMNSVTFTHPNPKEITRIKEAFLAQRLFSEFVPCPDELKDTVSPNRDEANASALAEKYGYTDWYSFAVNEWGTKWDTGGSDISALEENSITLFFDTAWSPPTTFYEKLLDMGWSVSAHYYEPGMNFVGKWEDGFDDYYDSIPSTSEEIQEVIPAEIDECWDLSVRADELAEEEEWNEDEDS